MGQLLVDRALGLGVADMGGHENVRLEDFTVLRRGSKGDLDRVWELVQKNMEKDGLTVVPTSGGRRDSERAARLVRSLAYPDRLQVIELPPSRLLAAYLLRLAGVLWDRYDRATARARLQEVGASAVSFIRRRGSWRRVCLAGAVGLGRRTRKVRTEIACLAMEDEARLVAACGRGGTRGASRALRRLLGGLADAVQVVEFSGRSSFGYTSGGYLELLVYYPATGRERA